jgi:hypothetical protein
MHQEGEYTDYSCSTSIERLSRDVETVLRAWHVDRGGDRHVSIAHQHNKHKQNQHKNQHQTQAHRSSKQRQEEEEKEDPTSSLIRSNPIQWNITLLPGGSTMGRTSLVVDLELALWDAPDSLVTEDEYEDDEELLVRSLRRSGFTHMPSHGSWFDNFSTLFGIGQHITLTPIQPEPIPAPICQTLGSSLLGRHDDQTTATWVLGSTLSGWLQTALNCAVANCHCCIPAFGVWGLYRPDQLLPVHPSSLLQIKSSSSSSTNSVSSDLLLGDTAAAAAPPSPVLRTGIHVFPKWVQAIRSADMPTVGRKYRARSQPHWNRHFIPPLLAGSVVCPSEQLMDQPNTSATFWCSVTPDLEGAQHNNNNIATHSRLAVWASVLLQHCPDATVVLSGGRHVFGWFKPLRPVRSSLFSNCDSDYDLAVMREWRHRRQEESEFELGDDDDDDELDLYRKDCREHALQLLQEAWGKRGIKTPLWGPLDDPVASVYATTTWHGKSNDDDDAGIVEPLMQFPLRIRSRRELSQRDWIDMEESVERTILNPLEPSKFCIQAYYDRETSVATLAANQRCILAALIRAATLPGETLLHHLTDESLVSRWDDKAGTIVANKLCDRTNVGEKTQQIVKAMDWSSIIEDMMESWQADEIMHQVMDGGLTLGFPSSPEEAFSEKDVFSPFRKSAPYGRLLSVLFGHMAKLRALSSMALVWGVFVQELRRRWEARESLPNMQYVPGLDPHPLVLYEKRCYSTIGLKANFAAFLNCSEPDPDDYHCLIGQKLQVFNLGVEGLVAGELAEHEAMERFLGAGEIPTSVSKKRSNGTPNRRSSIDTAESMISTEVDERESSNGKRKWPKAKDKANAAAAKVDQKNYGPPTIDTDLEFWVMDEPGHANNLDHGLGFAHPQTDDTGFDFVAPAPTNLDDLDMSLSIKSTASQSSRKRKQDNKIIVEGLPDQAWEGTIMDGSEAGSVATSCSQSQAYFDAAEAGSIFSMKNGFVNLDTVVNVADMQRRPGARCPVHEVTYGPECNQLYAPYLQRPYPLTDDVVRERRMMLERHPTDEKKKISLQYRIELSHRLQKPKLLSDMRAFKAANPDISFEDFTKWYGNPGNPLDDYHDEEEEFTIETAFSESAAKKLDKASEAMKVLMSTRDFWSSTWDEATAVPASEQKPLFDVGMSVEIALDYLEQMHPTNLLNQIMAVNLSAAYFTLVASADDALDIELVQTCVHKLRSKIDKALQKLSRDATAFSTPIPDFGSESSAVSQKYAADDTITACEAACTALGEVETMIARAISLLNKFPDQPQLIQNLLRLADGTPVRLDDQKGRISFLNAIHHQQQQHSTFSTLESLPKPVLREYVLRNLDESNPCQLSVRFGDEGAYLDRVDNEGGVLLALSKSYKD